MMREAADFRRCLGYLIKQHATPAAHYEGILQTLSIRTASALHVDNLKGAEGELGIGSARTTTSA